MLGSGIIDPKTAVTMSRTDIRSCETTFAILNLNHQVRRFSTFKLMFI